MPQVGHTVSVAVHVVPRHLGGSLSCSLAAFAHPVIDGVNPQSGVSSGMPFNRNPAAVHERFRTSGGDSVLTAPTERGRTRCAYF